MKHAVIVYIITTIKELERKLFFEYNYSAYLVHETGCEVQQPFYYRHFIVIGMFSCP
jgi:hypothetical protein